MSLVNNFRMLSRYNQRINKQLMQTCIALPEALLTKESHSFFPTILSYWNHLLFGDLILLGRLASYTTDLLQPEDLAQFPKPKTPRDIYYQQLPELMAARFTLDEVLIRFCENLTDEDCRQKICYTSTEGEVITKVVGDVIQHLFNHQTHHRGQLTCVLSQFSVDYGCMDLPVIVSEGSQ